jgi:hypothetical protein
MKKISIISPLNDFLDIPKKMNLLDNLLMNKYDYEVFFIYDKYLPKELNSTHKYTFIQTKLDATYNDKVVVGFNLISGSCALIIDFNKEHWQEYLIRLLVEWENGATIVLTKYKPSKIGFWQRIGGFFKGIFNKIYAKVLNILELGKDLKCMDTFQLFSENVYTIIKEFPEKNSYLRNFDCWVDQKIKVLLSEEKIVVDKEMPKWSGDLTKSLLLFIGALAYAVFMFFSYSYFLAKDAVFTYIALSILILFMLLFFGLYYLFVDFLHRRIGIAKNKG